MGYNKPSGMPQKGDDLLNYVLGKVPPSAVPLEDAVIGALLLDREAFALVDSILLPTDFYNPANGLIFSAVSRLAERGLPVDILTVTEELKKTGELENAGGGYYLVEMGNRVASAANIEYHARIIKQKAIQREIVALGMRAERSGHDDTADVFEILDVLEKQVYAIGHGAFKKSAKTAADIVAAALKQADAAMSQKGMTGVTSGMAALDKCTGGWQPTDLVIVAGRPGMGKTGFVLTCAINAAKAGLPVLFFSLEMSEVQIGQRIVAQESGVGMSGMRNGTLSQDDFRRMQEAAERVSLLPITVDDTPAITLSELRSKARRAVSRDGVKMIVVDYLQLMTGSEQNTIDRVGNNVTGLKALAKELNVPILLLSQLNRAVETRGGAKRPQLSDLRDTGQIEQDADVVAFLYRAEYYGITEGEDGSSTAGKAEVIFAKHRNGATGFEEVGFKDTTASFFDLSEVQYGVHAPPPPSFPANSARPDLEKDDIPF